MSKRTSKKSSYRTVGAVSGHFLSDAERAANTKIAEQSRGAQLARAEDAAMLSDMASKYLGKCPLCDAHVHTGKVVSTLADCPRCEMYRADPDHWYIGEDGTWWAV